MAKYWVDNMVREGKKNPEPIVRSFIVERADTLRFTRQNWKEWSFFQFKKYGDDEDLNVIRVLNTLKEYFRKKIKSNIMDENGKTREYEYYFYDLNNDLKEILHKEMLVWNVNPQLPTNKFYGFSDPTFYRKGKMIASVLSQEGNIHLHLTDTEKKKLEAEGVELKKVDE